MTDFVTQDALNKAVLFKLFLASQNGDGNLPSDVVAKSFRVTVGSKRVDLAYEFLDSQQWVDFSPSVRRASINLRGYSNVEKQLSLDTSFYSMYAQSGDEWLARHTIAKGDVPAADRIVLRSDNQNALEEFDSRIDVIIGELNSNNTVGDELGDERELLLSEASASKELIKGSRFRLSKLLQLIVPTLRFLAEKFSGAAIGEAAKHLITLVMALL